MAIYYFINGGTDNNWNTVSNWSLSSGGPNNGSIPTSSDDAYLDSNSPNCIIDANPNAFCNNFTCTGYTNTLDVRTTFGIVNNFILSSGMTFITTNVLAIIRISASYNDININTFGKVFNCFLDLSGSGFVTNLLSTLTNTNIIYAQSTIFGGPFGFVTNMFSIYVETTLASGITYVVNNQLIGYNIYSQSGLLNSSNPGTQAILNFTGSSHDMTYVNATDIDSSGGNPIYTFHGTLSNTKNWNAVITPKATGGTFIN